MLGPAGSHGVVPADRERADMTDADSAKRVECDRYRTMANEIRALLPRLSQSEAIEELRLLAIRYEKLAEHLEAAP